ncbi:Sel1 repeat family protein [Psychrobacter okhotskensis]|uniref:tetratricopeptide repeat protein n=1 Tax=Psychrobacter okhotskensis TaxID=212403 RepID=UPI003F5568F6
MKAINQSSLSSNATKAPTFATLTALAAACALMLSAPVNAAEADSSANASTTATNPAVPSAMDSSRRVIRLAKPNATAATSTAQTDVPSNMASGNSTQSSNVLPTNPASVNAQQNRAPQNNSAQQSQAPLSNAQPSAAVPQAPTAATPELTGTTRVYERGPMTATGIDLRGGQLPNIPTPQVQLSSVSFVPTVLVPQQQGLGTDKLDVSLLDDFIEDVSPNARHYPPNFPNRSQRHYTREKIKVLTEWIEPYAQSPNASYDVLIRAAKLNGMGRNLDLGSDYTVRGGKYVDRAIKIKPDSGEANFLYGMMLSEGGGFKEGQKYLDRAVSLGYTEAEQSLAQSDLLSDRRDNALERLRRLEQQVPNNTVIRQQIKLVEDGKFYIWDIPAPDIDVKPGA